MAEKAAFLNYTESKIQRVINPDTSSFDSRINNLFTLIRKNRLDDQVKLSDIPISSIDSSVKQLENLLTNKSVLKKYRIREAERQRKEMLHKKEIRQKLTLLETLITQSKIEESRFLIDDLNRSIKPNYEKELIRLNRAKENFKTKEYQIFKKKQDEILKRQAEEVEKLRLEEEKRKKELAKDLEFELNPVNEETLAKYKIDYIFHMTEISNLPNILKFGLLPHNEAHSKGLNKTDIALQDVNQRRANKKPIHGISLHDYVPMYFNPKNPMLFKRKQIQDSIIILAIDRRILYHEKSIFSDGNAASDATRFYNHLQDLEKLNWACIRTDYWNNFQDGKRIRCAETLAHPKIPIKYIKKIHCNSIKTKVALDQAAPLDKSFRVELNSKYFFNRY